MIIIKLYGGLGNQMFQYAFGRKISIANNRALKLDIKEYKIKQNRSFALKPFNIKADIATAKDIDRYIKRNKIIKKIYKTLDSFRPINTKKIITEPHFHFSPDAINAGADVYIDGHWQSEKYFKDIKDIIKNEFKLKKPIDSKYKNILNAVHSAESVSIHFRKTDYASSKHLRIYHGLNLNYYQAAISLIKEKISNPIFFIFSDDIEWVKNNIPLPSSSVFVSRKNLKDYEELIFMSNCKHNIIANSTFSWWGAWLNRNPEKQIIAPKKWFKDTNINIKDLIPKSWIGI